MVGVKHVKAPRELRHVDICDLLGVPPSWATARSGQGALETISELKKLVRRSATLLHPDISTWRANSTTDGAGPLRPVKFEAWHANSLRDLLNDYDSNGLTAAETVQILFARADRKYRSTWNPQAKQANGTFLTLNDPVIDRPIPYQLQPEKQTAILRSPEYIIIPDSPTNSESIVSPRGTEVNTATTGTSGLPGTPASDRRDHGFDQTNGSSGGQEEEQIDLTAKEQEEQTGKEEEEQTGEEEEVQTGLTGERSPSGSLKQPVDNEGSGRSGTARREGRVDNGSSAEDGHDDQSANTGRSGPRGAAESGSHEDDVCLVDEGCSTVPTPIPPITFFRAWAAANAQTGQSSRCTTQDPTADERNCPVDEPPAAPIDVDDDWNEASNDVDVGSKEGPVPGNRSSGRGKKRTRVHWESQSDDAEHVQQSKTARSGRARNTKPSSKREQPSAPRKTRSSGPSTEGSYAGEEGAMYDTIKVACKPAPQASTSTSTTAGTGQASSSARAGAESISRLLQLAADPTGRRVVIARVPALDETTDQWHIVTAGFERPPIKAGRIVQRLRFQVVARDMDGMATSGTGRSNSIKWTGITGRGGTFVGRFRGSSEKEIRDFCEALSARANLFNTDLSGLPLESREPV